MSMIIYFLKSRDQVCIKLHELKDQNWIFKICQGTKLRLLLKLKDQTEF